MDEILLGGVRVARIGLGTNRLTNTPESAALLTAAIAAGVRMIDTAHLYTGGDSERAIGVALAPPAEGCVIATKGGYADGRPETLREEIKQSLHSLRTSCIDLYYLHRVDPNTPLEDSLAVIREHVDAGTIRHVGLSNVTIEQIERARRVVPIAAIQNHYNLAERGHDVVVDYCTAEQIPFVPYFPLRAVTPGLEEIAKRHDTTAAQVTLAWLLRRSPMMLPIPGTLSADHVRENVAAGGVDLTDDEFDTLSRVA
ncbi:MAG: aldo/keto reductase [Candidatus Dormibacteria bacterium]